MILALILQATAFTCTPVALYDADGPLWCKEGPRIRTAATPSLALCAAALRARSRLNGGAA